MVSSRQIEEFQKILDEGKKIVFFTGAGVSTDSGIPDFRSRDGLYSMKYKYPPETIISHSFFEENHKEFFRFYKDKMLNLDAKPNFTHLFMASLEKKGRCLGVVTQNIDGLHTAAGSKHVYELHGSVLRNYCTHCHTFYDAKFIRDSQGIPVCPKDGAIIKPDVVLYEEELDNTVVSKAIHAITSADVLVVLGTSLVVYPAAGLIDYFQGEHLVLINRTVTSYDHSADLRIEASFNEVFPKLIVR